MKRSINILLFVFAVFAFSANMVFAQSGTGIASVPVGLEGDPGSIIIARATTDVNGKFACKLLEGKYKLIISYNDIASKVSRTDKNFASKPGSYIFTLILGLMPNIKAPARVLINKENGPISISVSKGGGTLSGTLTYTKR